MNTTEEEYIEVIYLLAAKKDCARARDIATSLKIRPSSVTEMIQRLVRKNIVEHEPYKEVRLTSRGKHMAKALMRKEKILQEFLLALGVEQSRAQIDACGIEHCVSQATIERLRIFLRFIRGSPRKPIWLEHFHHYCRTGERLKCDIPYIDGKK